MANLESIPAMAIIIMVRRSEFRVRYGSGGGRPGDDVDRCWTMVHMILAGEQRKNGGNDKLLAKKTLQKWREASQREMHHHLPSVLPPKFENPKQFSRQNVYVSEFVEIVPGILCHPHHVIFASISV